MGAVPKGVPWSRAVNCVLAWATGRSGDRRARDSHAENSEHVAGAGHASGNAPLTKDTASLGSRGFIERSAAARRPGADSDLTAADVGEVVDSLTGLAERPKGETPDWVERDHALFDRPCAGDGSTGKRFRCEMCAQYFGLDSSAASVHEGDQILTTGRCITRSGRELMTELHLLNKGGARTRWHDTMKNCVFASLKEAGVHADTEVFGVVADIVASPAGRARLYERYSPAHRRTLVPDLLLTEPATSRERLADVKTLAWTLREIPAVALPSGGRRPVDRRADAINGDYIAHARDIDISAKTPRPDSG